jgi:hypothetical protein
MIKNIFPALNLVDLLTPNYRRDRDSSGYCLSDQIGVKMDYFNIMILIIRIKHYFKFPNKILNRVCLKEADNLQKFHTFNL